MTSSEVAVDPLEWLADLTRPDDDEYATAGDSEPRPEGMAESEAPRVARPVGGADPAWAFTDEAHAEATLEGTANICKNHCPIAERCATERCTFYRLEKAAETYLAGDTDWLI